MHKDGVRVTPDQVHQLLVSQCPQWADLPVVPLSDGAEGTDHVLFRVGDDLVARMPKVAYAGGRSLR
jgi:aminoglycoside phosphotransferase (APT) family kinase protein